MSAAQSGLILAVGPSAGGVADVFSGSLGALESSGRSVVAERLPETGSSALVAAKSLRRRWRQLRGAASVHVEFGSNDLAVFWFACLAVLVRTDVVLVVHDPPEIAHAPAAGLIARTSRWRERIAYRVLSPTLDRAMIWLVIHRAGALVVLGTGAQELLRERTSKPVIFAPHGGKPLTAASVPPSRGEYVLFAGYLGPSKGLDVLLKAWSLVGEIIGLRLVIVGDAGAGDAEWVESLREESATHRAPPEWIGRVESESDFQAWFEQAAIVVLPYRRSSPASGILVRSMLAGRCVLATRVEAVANVVDDGVSGALVDVGDDASLASRLTALGRDGRERDRLGAGAARRAEELFGWSRFMEALERGYAAAGGARA